MRTRTSIRAGFMPAHVTAIGPDVRQAREPARTAVNFNSPSGADRRRANPMGSRVRAGKPLDLLTIGLNGRADERAFAKAIRMYLEGLPGTSPAHKAPRDDPMGAR